MAKVFTIEVTKESRALLQIEAESGEEAREIVRQQVADDAVEWKMKDHLIMDVINTREKKG